MNKFPKENPNDFKYEIKKGLNNIPYASLPIGNSKKFKWKYFDEDVTNAFQIYKFWHSPNEIATNFKYMYPGFNKFNYNVFVRKFKTLKKELLKYNIYFYFLDYMGKWSNINLHFIDYSWTDASNLALEDNPNLNIKDISYIFIDDVSLLKAILYGKLYFYHQILNKDIPNLKLVFKNILNFNITKFSNSNAISFKLKKII